MWAQSKSSSFAHDYSLPRNNPFGELFVADSSTATGLKWQAPASGGMSANLTLLNTGGTALTGAASITVNVSAYDRYYIYIQQASFGSGDVIANLRINGDTTNKYGFIGFGWYGTGLLRDWYTLSQTSRFQLGNQGNTAGDDMFFAIDIIGGKSSVIKRIQSVGVASGSSTSSNQIYTGQYTGTAEITSLTFYTNSATNWDNGTVFIYGA